MQTILIIDDDQDLNLLLSKLFLGKGMRVFTAASFAQAVDQSVRKRIDLILLDYQLGDGLGTDLLNRVRQAHPAARIIMMSGHDTPELRAECDRQGMLAFLPKPLDIPTLEALTHWQSAA